MRSLLCIVEGWVGSRLEICMRLGEKDPKVDVSFFAVIIRNAVSVHAEDKVESDGLFLYEVPITCPFHI